MVNFDLFTRKKLGVTSERRENIRVTLIFGTKLSLIDRQIIADLIYHIYLKNTIILDEKVKFYVELTGKLERSNYETVETRQDLLKIIDGLEDELISYEKVIETLSMNTVTAELSVSKDLESWLKSKFYHWEVKLSEPCGPKNVKFSHWYYDNETFLNLVKLKVVIYGECSELEFQNSLAETSFPTQAFEFHQNKMSVEYL